MLLQKQFVNHLDLLFDHKVLLIVRLWKVYHFLGITAVLRLLICFRHQDLLHFILCYFYSYLSLFVFVFKFANSF